MTKQGRPAGLLANPDAFTDALGTRTQKWLAEQADMSVSHLSEVLSGRKGVGRDQADRLAITLGYRVGTLFPQLAAFRVEARVFTVTGTGDLT